MKNPVTTIKNNIVLNRELKVKETESRILANSAAALKDSTISGAVAVGTAGVVIGATGFIVVKGVKGIAHGVGNIKARIKNRKKGDPDNGANNGGGEV